MEGTVQYEGSGDVFFAFYNGDQQLTEMPKKDNSEGLGFEKAVCDKGASVEWDSNKWAPLVVNLSETKTKCTLYFSKMYNLKEYIENLAEEDTTTLAYDDTSEKNLRYIGASPNNYIDIGDRDSNGDPILWRIIGVMNNMTVINEDDSESTGQSLIKIIRADTLEDGFSWDSSASGVNSGWGVNEWSQADIMTTLNTEAYWSKESGQCYSSYNDEQTACNFSSTGLTPEVKEKLAKVRWNTGTFEKYNTSDWLVNATYKAERSNHNGKEQCASSGGSWCNDDVERTTTWDGYIGLMYPSDYGYAVGGSVRSECLAKSMFKWTESSPSCKGNDWLRDSYNTQWTITPAPDSESAFYAFRVSSSGHLMTDSIAYGSAVRPVAYLKSTIKIQEKSDNDYGSESNPFVLEGVS